MTQPENGMSRGLSATITSEILVAAVVVLFLLFLVLFFFYLYTKRYHGAIPTISSSRIRLILAPLPHHGLALDPAVIQSLPVVVFRPEDFKEGIECAVCLSELCEGEESRVLPKCNHGFHLECIDMWFHSNNTCPLCRSPVNRVVTGLSAAAPTSTQEGSSMVIEIPRRVEDGLPSPAPTSSSSRSPEEEIVSPQQGTGEIAVAIEGSTPVPKTPTNHLDGIWCPRTGVSGDD